jgi:hypothetical protein
MAILQPTNTPIRHVFGNLVARHYTVAGTNGDTLTVPQSNIIHVDPTPNSPVSVGVLTIVGSTITFATVGAFQADVMVYSRIG